MREYDRIEWLLVKFYEERCCDCPYYLGIANKKVCSREVQCLSDGAFNEIRELLLKGDKPCQT